MSKSIYICSRNKISSKTHYQLELICKKIAPDNITPRPPKVFVNNHIAYAVMNPSDSALLEAGNSLLIGQIFFKNSKWFKPLEEFPDGSYALFRDNERYCEMVSDQLASRTIWYYFDENNFIASTSQRMIIMFVGSFEFDERVIPWMLSTGTLGPDFSWDKRIKRVPPNSSVVLSKDSWSISIKSNPVEFNLVERSDEDHEKLFKEAHKITFKNIDIDFSKWVLPLSGGYDSRGILCFLNEIHLNIHNLRTITWGLKSSAEVKENDAYIAKVVANAFNVSHKYYHTDLSEESVETIINRFILMGEGRIDHITAYLDGFKMFKSLFEEGIQGIIRGDIGFTGQQAPSSLKVKKNINCCTSSDFHNLKNYSKYGFPQQIFPDRLKRRKHESMELWRDRLYHQYRNPIILAALSDLKLSYIEQINPLLSKRILKQVRELPDHLRTKKALFKKMVISLSPGVEFATKEAESSLEDILKMSEFVIFLKKELTSNDAKKILPANFLEFILKGIKTEKKDGINTIKSFSIKSYLKNIAPAFIKNNLRRFLRPNVDPNILAFRVVLIMNMYRILNEEKDFLQAL